MKKTIVAGNWKMHKTPHEARAYLEEFLPLVQESSAHVLLAVSYVHLEGAVQCAKNSVVGIGAQNISEHPSGAFTGEISGSMIQDTGASFVLVGHSERRQYFHETDELVNLKALKALETGLVPMVCFGETLSEREASIAEQVLQTQLEGALKGMTYEQLSRVILAYEPVWAIGTGKTASVEVAQQTHKFCRQFLIQTFGEALAKKIPMLYGGSVKLENALELMRQEDIDGVLVGGASLDPKGFAQIVNCTRI
ncbi:MAG: triose-phosphate isomerase [Chlamydiae bacterium]|nr:triose-phosphate isomerase [Chlamydiota bacterium]